MEEQHPIPQQISSYQFRLVGDMTLKQFFQIAGGSVISLLIYSSGLHPVVKWPLVLLSFLSGIALAFLPLQDRPLEVWILAFFKSIYSPTVFTWSKNKSSQSLYQPENVPAVTPVTPQPVSPVPTPSPVTLPKAPPSPPVTPPAPQAPVVTQPVPQTPPPAPITTFINDQTLTNKVTKPEEQKVVAVPQVSAIKVEPHEKIEIPLPNDTAPLVQESKNEFYSPAATQQVTGAQQANFSQASAPPMPPTKANVIVGQVVGNNGEIVENAILEIKDAEGRSVRALRSNKLGHFMIITPLSDGRYDIITEKESFYFDPVSIEAKGEIIPPIAIKATEKPVNTEAQTVPPAPAIQDSQGLGGGDIYKTI